MGYEEQTTMSTPNNNVADQETGYLPGVEIYKGYALSNPYNCAVKERTGDGVPVGPCCYYLDNGTTCPRHGKVKANKKP